MRLFALIGLIGIVGGRVTTWLLKQRRPRIADALRVSTMIFERTVVAVLFGLIAIHLAQDDDPLRRAIAVVVGLLALATAALGALHVWGWRKYGPSEKP